MACIWDYAVDEYPFIFKIHPESKKQCYERRKTWTIGHVKLYWHAIREIFFKNHLTNSLLHIDISQANRVFLVCIINWSSHAESTVYWKGSGGGSGSGPPHLSVYFLLWKPISKQNCKRNRFDCKVKCGRKQTDWRRHPKTKELYHISVVGNLTFRCLEIICN